MRRRSPARERLRSLLQAATRRHAICLLATTIILTLGAGAALLQTVAITLAADKIGQTDLKMLHACSTMQVAHLQRMDRLAELLRRATTDGNADEQAWNETIEQFHHRGQQVAEALQAAVALSRQAEQVWGDYQAIGGHLETLQEKCYQLENESASLIRLAEEGRVDELRVLGPFAQREGEVIGHRIAAVAEAVHLSVGHSTSSLQIYAAQLSMGWVVAPALLLLCVTWCLGKDISHRLSAATRPASASAASVTTLTATAGAAVAPASSEPAPRLANRRILLAEDGAANQRLISAVLQSAGARVDVTSDGQEALERMEEVRAQGLNYDVVVTDLQMPIMDGLELIRRLRSNQFAGGIVALTGCAGDAVRQQCFEHGCDAFLNKPVGREDLISAVHQQLRRSPVQRTF